MTKNNSSVRSGFHARRVPLVDLALWDVVGTVALGLFTGGILRGGATIRHIIIWFLLGMFLHQAFLVATPLTRLTSVRFLLESMQRSGANKKGG